MNLIQNNITYIVIICMICTILGCAGSQSYEDKLAIKYQNDTQDFESRLKSNNSDYIKFEITTAFMNSSSEVTYFIYPTSNGLYEYLKISGMYRYRPRYVHETTWQYYTTILSHLTDYDCLDHGAPPPYYVITYYHNGVAIRSRISDNQWLTTDEGLLYPSNEFRSAESQFIHRFIMATFGQQFRDLLNGSPAIR